MAENYPDIRIFLDDATVDEQIMRVASRVAETGLSVEQIATTFVENANRLGVDLDIFTVDEIEDKRNASME
jgi:hypothetical protein